MALPFTIVALALAWNLASCGRVEETSLEFRWGLRLIVTGVVVGSLYALNAWDFPTFLIAVVFGAFVGASLVRRAWLSCALVIVAAVAAWLPFVARYTPPAGFGLERLPAWLETIPLIPRFAEVLAPYVGERTSTGEYLTMFGIPYCFGIALLVTGASSSQSYRMADSPGSRSAHQSRRPWWRALCFRPRSYRCAAFR